jgi:hypothetical protein
MQKILNSFDDLEKIELATASGSSVNLLGYFFDTTDRTRTVSLPVSGTAATVLQLYRNAIGSTTARLPYPALVIKPTTELYVTIENQSGWNESLEPGVYYLGENAASYRIEFERREVAETEKGRVPLLNLYYFIGDSASGTINGIFVDDLGSRTGSAFNGNVTTTTAVNFEDLYGQALPADAVGAIVDFSADMCFDITRDEPATAKSNLATNKSNHPTADSGNGFGYGKVI